MGHCLGLVTFDKNKNDVHNAKDAMISVEDFLDRERFSEATFFSSAPSDYFSIGNGYAKYALLIAEHNCADILKGLRGGPSRSICPIAFFVEYVNRYKKKPPFIPYPKLLQPEGCASIVTENIYNNLLIEHLGTNRDDDNNFWDLDFESVDKSFIGKKWIVAFDCHR